MWILKPDKPLKLAAWYEKWLEEQRKRNGKRKRPVFNPKGNV